MARKSTKKKQEEERNERLNRGGQRIAAIARQEVERRQQEGFKKSTTNAGIKAEYSYKDPIARTATKEIEKRQALSSWLNKMEEEERQQREESQNRTKAWQEAYNKAQQGGNEGWKVYAAKMMNDTPGALEREKDRLEKQRQEIAKKNLFAVRSNFGDPVKLQAKNELTEKIGQVRSKKNALNNYISALKENKAAKEKRSQTLSGTDLQGPVVKPEQAMKQYQKNVQKKHDERTKYWQDTYNEAQRNGQGWQVYANKLILDTPGALEKEQARKQKASRERTRFWQDEYNKAQQNGGQGWQVYAQKMVSDTPGAYEREQGRNRRAYQQLQEYLDRVNKQSKVAGNHTGWEANREEIGTPTIGSYNSMNANRLGERDQGIYDIGTNPMYMSNSGLDKYTGQYYQKANELRKQAEGYRNAGYTGLFDYVEGLKRNNEETILRSQYYTREQQGVAEKELLNLQKTYDSRRQAAMDNGRKTIEGYRVEGFYGTANMFDDIVGNQDKKVLYKTLTGEDYDQRTAHMTPEQIEELDRRIEEARSSILNYNQDDYDNMLKEADAYEQLAKQASGEQTTRKKIDELTKLSQRYESAEYDPSLINIKTYYADEYHDVAYTEPAGSREDQAYYYMNNKPAAGDPENSIVNLRKEYFATPEMVDAYNRLYKADKTNGTNTASAFLDAIDPYLTSWNTEYTDYFIREKAENPMTGIPMRLFSFPLNAVNAIPSMINTGIALFNKAAADPNNPVNLVNKLTTTTREEQNKDIDTALGGNGTVEFLLGVADSIGDNLMAMGTGGALTGNVASKAGMAVVQMIMSGEATGHTFLEKLEEKKDPTEAALYAIGDGVIEWFTEKVSLEALLKPDVKSMLGNTKQLLKYFGLTSLAEGSEEIASDFLNWGLDSILSMAFDHETELKERYYELIGSGMGEKQAWRQALTEKFEQIGLSGLAGAISGGLMSMGRAATNYVSNWQAGNLLQGSGKVNNLVNLGLQSGKGTLSLENAEAIRRKMEAGKKPGSAEVGKLAQSMMLENRESMDQKTEQARLDSIVKDLVKQNVPEADAVKLAETIGKALDMGGIEKLSKRERDAIHASQAAVNTLYKYTFDKQTFDNLQKEVSEKTKSEAGTIASVSNMFRKPGTKPVSNDFRRNYEEADSDGYRNATGTEVKGNRGIIVYGKDGVQHAKLLNLAATKNKKGQLMYNVEIDGKQQLVNAAQIRTKNAGTAAIIASQTNNPRFYNQAYVNAMLMEMDNAKEDVNPGTFMMDAMRIRYAALEQQAMPETQMPADMAQRLYQTAQQSYVEYRKNEQEKANVWKPGETKVYFKETEAGTAEFDAALEKANLSEREKENIRTLAGLMKAAGGQNITFVDNDDIREMEKTRKGLRVFKDAESELYGEQSISGILVNIEGQNFTRDLETGEKKATGKHHIGIALGHEFTHFLQTHSVNGWNELSKYVMDEQRKVLGEAGLNEAISNYMDNQGISLEEAVAEFVADSCESIFNNKDVLDHIQQTNKTLFGQIRDFVKDLINRVRKAMMDSQSSMTAAGARMVNGNLRELAKRFNLAYDEAVSGETGEETGAEVKTSRFSKSDVGEGGLSEDKYFKRIANNNTYYRGNSFLKIGTITEGGALNQVGIPAAELRYDYSKLNYNLSKHESWLTPTILAEIPEIIRNPIVITEYQQKPNTITVFGDIEVKGQPVIVGIVVSKSNNGLLVQPKVRTVNIRSDYKDLINDNTVLYITTNKNKANNWFTARGINVPLGKNQYGLIRKIQLNEEIVNSRKSRAQLDNEYMAAVESGDTERQQELVDDVANEVFSNSKVKGKDGKLLRMYHGTGSEFNEFKREYIGSTGRFEGSGFNFTPYEGRAASYGKNVLTGYLDIQKPLSAEKKTISVQQLARIIREADPTGDNIIANYARETRDYGSESFVRREAMTAARQIWNYSENDVDIYSEISSADPDAESLISKFEDLEYDGLIHYDEDGNIKTAVAFSSNQFKRADPVLYDDGKLIELKDRFNRGKEDIRYSRALTEEQQATVDAAEEQGIDLDPVNQTASFFYSRASFERSEYYKNPEEMARMLAKNVLGSESKANIAKATKWIKDVTSISAMIAERPEILDYIASPGRSSFKSNPEYGGSIDSSTICAKRRLQTGTLDAIQRALPDYAMTAEDFLRVRRMMKDRGYEVSCGLCFVESSRKNIAKYAKQFMNEWNSQHPDNQVNMTQINTVLGLENTRINNKEVYAAYEKFMNKLAQRKPKLFEMRSEYDNDIIKHFRNDDSVEAKNRNGGMRINSFSDFEIVHLIDMMQVIMDMSNVGLAGQAYTKVREFAEALGPTGLKINMSMIAAGVDENGKIIFDEVEGMKWDDVRDLRDKYADNVGTVCVVFTEDQLMAAMADDRIDFIIPFHRSQWSKSNYADIGLPENVKDFTYWQNERYREPVYGTKKDGTKKKLRATNYMPNEYWNPNLSGKENAEAYLRMCYENNKIPKFWKWLQSNGDGSFSLKEDGSTDGYWKLLGDFKMYNHMTGEYTAQMPVKPEFDMDASRRMLEEYKGGHETFPEATDVVQDFVKEKTQGRKGLSAGKNGKIKLAANEIENSRLSRWTESAMDVNYWMEHVTPSALQTEDEWKMVQAYRGKRTSMALSLKKQLDMKAQIRQLEGKVDLTTDDRNALIKLRNNLKTEQDKYARLEDEIAEITSDSGWAGIMRQHNVVFRDYMEGKTQEQVQAAIDSLTEEVKRSGKNIARQEKELAKMEEESAVQTAKKLLARKGLARTAAALRSEYFTAMSEEELKNRLAEIVIRSAMGEDITADVEALAEDVITNQTGAASEVADEQLYPLRGMTVELSPAQMKELKAKDSSLAEIRRRTKGSGIRFVEGDRFTLEDNIGDIIDENPELRDKLENAGNSLDNFVDYVEGLLQLKQQQAADNIDRAELETFITASANIMLNENAGGMNRTQLTDVIRQEAGKIGRALAAVREVKGSMEGLKAAGQKAQTWAGVLNEDTQQALKYYNKMARLAAETERKRVKQTVIESLKSDHAKAMLQQAEKFREQMANDKKARELAEDNAALRSKVSTLATRMANRIFAETDQKNVPEETKALVRQVLDMISQHDGFFRKVTYWDKQQVDNVRARLQKMISNYGAFDTEADLNWLVVGQGQDADYTARDAVEQDLINIETGLMEYRNAEGKGRISLADRKAALEKVQKALSEIWDVISARSEMEIAGRKWQVIEMAELMNEEMAKSRFKGERTGFGSRARNTISGGVTWGNLTPEYFFKNLKNRAMEMLHRGLKEAENRSGLEAAKAKNRLAQIAQENGFATWDGQEEHKVRTRSGEITMTTEQVMALYATWLRESNQMRPEDTAHLLHGGFVLAEKEKKNGLPGREKKTTRPIRMSKDQLNALGSYLTEEQKQYVNDMVAYMSGELAELGNEASMKMYGIKKFTEKFYYPIKSWGGVLNKRSDAGIQSSRENRAAQQGFSKRIKNNAANAIEIGDFTPTAIKHVAGMITYNTVAPAIENMNKVLNQQLQYGEIKYTPDGAEVDLDDTYKQNMRAAFENAYGKQAGDYLAKFMKDMNGGVTTERTPFDKLLSMFKKNAVAGSLSVAAQQPLSYIRAAMMINPKYLAAAISPQYWKGSYAEMMKHSGVAVIKEMGKFDMNFGQTMQEWITPEGMESKARKAWNKTTDLVTGLPGAMDMMTWTRMWTAVKLEQMAENKGADYTSDEFMEKVAERFNDLMRKTQVYDSVMTKSQNMRSQHFYAKTLTSFMAEPTLTLNVLADAMQNVKEKGGKAKAAKAVATFLLSAAAQAGVKAFFGAGRSPDKKKNREENFLNKFWYNLLSEANPFGLIPGYRQIVETMTDGEFKDDTMGMIAKMTDVVENIWKLATGEIGKKGLYRDLEDSIGQMLQLMTDIPAKNIMRDFRAMANWFSNGAAKGITGDTYAQRETSQAMLKYQFIDTLMSNDLLGMINKKLEEAGYRTTNAAYYQRIVDAEKNGNLQAAEQMKEYLIKRSDAADPEKTVNDAIRKLKEKDDSLSGPEKVQVKLDAGQSVQTIKTWITQNYKAEYIKADTDGRRKLMNELTKMYKLLGISGEDAMKIVTKWVKDEKKKQ